MNRFAPALLLLVVVVTAALTTTTVVDAVPLTAAKHAIRNSSTIKLLWQKDLWVGLRSETFSSPLFDAEKNWLYVNSAIYISILNGADGSTNVSKSNPGSSGFSDFTKVGNSLYHTAKKEALSRDAATLDVIWNFTAPSYFFGTPIYAADQNALFAVMAPDATNGSLYKLDPSTGAQLWTVTLPPSGYSVQYASYSKKYRLVFSGRAASSVVAINVTSVRIAWELTTNGQPITTGVLSDDEELVFFGTKQGTIYAIAVQTGKLAWHQQAGVGKFSSPSYRNGVLYIGSKGGNCYAFNGATGKQLWVKATRHPGTTIGPSRIFGDKVFFPTY